MLRKSVLVTLPFALVIALATYGGPGHQPPKAESGVETSTLSQQLVKYDPNSPSSWPDSLEAVVAAPNNHKVLLENERVRVLEVIVRPGEREPVHMHRWPSVLYLDKGADFRDFDGEGKLLFDSRQATPPIKYPMTLWKGPEAPHAVENLSKKTPIHLIRVELKE